MSYLYIDESGAFDEGVRRVRGERPQRASLVGGICSEHSPEQWAALHQEFLRTYNERKPRCPFEYPRDFHCAEVLLGRANPAAEEAERNDFVRAVVSSILRQTCFVFASVNRERDFYYSRQATYGVNLSAALNLALEQLAQRKELPDSVTVVIAQRSIAETRVEESAQFRSYFDDLRPFLTAQIQAGQAAGAKLAKSLAARGTLHVASGIGATHAGLMAADFICNRLRAHELALEKVIQTSPGESVPNDFDRYARGHLRTLLEGGSYAAALCYSRRTFGGVQSAPQLAAIVKSLGQQSDAAILARELPAVLFEARYLIGQGSTDRAALDLAGRLLDEVIRTAQEMVRHHGDETVKVRWAGLLTQALAEKMAYYDHVGHTSAQKGLEGELREHMAQPLTRKSGTFTQQKEYLLWVRNRNLNVLFNDYRFQEVIDFFEQDVAQRENEIPKDMPDELLGEMLGSIGQACAFLARTQPEWAGIAHDYFIKSRKQFVAGSLFEAMAINFLAALEWQQGKADEVLPLLIQHKGAPRVASTSDLLQNFGNILARPSLDPYTAVLYGKVAAEAVEQGSSLPRPELQLAARSWKSRQVHAHPHQLLAKWLGYLLFLTGSFDDARTWCDDGLRICDSLEFTVRTMALPLVGLKAICWLRVDKRASCAETLSNFQARAATLGRASPAFAKYLASFGGEIKIGAELSPGGAGELAALMRLLPFTYS